MRLHMKHFDFQTTFSKNLYSQYMSRNSVQDSFPWTMSIVNYFIWENSLRKQNILHVVLMKLLW